MEVKVAGDAVRLATLAEPTVLLGFLSEIVTLVILDNFTSLHSKCIPDDEVF